MVQAPARDAFGLLDWIMSRHVHEYLDVAGRPVGEGRSAAFRHVHTEMQSCPYAGSRHHHAKPMNVSALRQILPAWEDVLTTLSWLSQRFRARRRKDVTTYDDLSLVTAAGVFLVDFLVLRQHQPLHSREIPVLISGVYKVCLGFQLATFLGSVRERFGGEPAPAPLPDPAGFYARLEGQDLLIGEAEVCSGSAAMIMQAYEAMTGRHAVAPGALPPTCADLAIAWEQFDEFTQHTADVWSELTQYVIRAEQFCPELTDPQLPPESRQRLNDHLKRRGAQLLAEQKGLVVDVARAARDHCGPPAARRPRMPGPPGSSPNPQPGSLAAVVLAWLSEVAGDDVRHNAPVVAGELRSRLAPYEDYEATVLAELNRHLRGLMLALGLDRPGAALTASALARVCGRTLRDWGDTSG